jgi:predicted nucleotidyltransferase
LLAIGSNRSSSIDKAAPMKTLADHRRERDDLIERLAEVLARGARFPAAWLYGSLGRGDADAMSDIDLALVTMRPLRLCRPWMAAARRRPAAGVFACSVNRP